MSNFKYSFEKGILTILKCPDTLAPEHINLISNEVNLKKIKKIILPDNIESIIDKTFCYMKFSEIILPKSLKKIGRYTFEMCKNLKYIEIPEGVELIPRSAFEGSGIKHIKLPNSLKIIGYKAFFKSELKSIEIPEGVETLQEEAFHSCQNLQKVSLPSTLRSIETYAFGSTLSLKEIELPKNLTCLGDSVFENSGLNKIVFNEGIEVLPSYTFFLAYKLKEVILPSNLKEIEPGAFKCCRSLRKIELPDTLEKLGDIVFDRSGIKKIKLPSSLKEIGEGCFKSCDYLLDLEIPEGIKDIKRETFFGSSIKKIQLPSSLTTIHENAFDSCYFLTKIEIPEGVKNIKRCAFKHSSLKEIKLPTTIEKVNCYAFSNTYLRRLIVKDDGEEKIINVRPEYFVENMKDKILLSRGNYLAEIEFYNNGKYVKYHPYPFLRKYKHGTFVERDPFVRINAWYWYNKNKFMPHYTVIENMPIEDIDMFYINNNCEVWKQILEKSNIKQDDNKATLFKLCYVLGVFQKEGNKRDTAAKFIKSYIISKMDEYKMHSLFDGFDLSNGYDEMFAQFFMKYYKENPYSLYDNHNCRYFIDSAYNNFKEVKRLHPNKKVNTNRERDLLLPEHVKNAVLNKHYENVDDENEEFAIMIGSYGYTQEQFEELQQWYNKAKQINKEKLKIFIGKDVDDKNNVTYELLEKDNPLGAVLGNITNCCQIVGGAGASCVKYGMTKPNSKFMTFNYKKDILGQAWVWYDEHTRTVCLDNIEVPEKYINLIKKDQRLQESFIACIKRVGYSFIKEMKNNDFIVEKVTVGKGYNDVDYLLKKNFNIDENSNRLSDNQGYSDADSQYEIVNISKR